MMKKRWLLLAFGVGLVVTSLTPLPDMIAGWMSGEAAEGAEGEAAEGGEGAEGAPAGERAEGDGSDSESE